MAESATVSEIQTQTAKDLQKTNESAMKSANSGGLNDPEFLKGLQDAIDRDASKTPAQPQAAPAATAAPAKPAVAPPAAPTKPAATQIPKVDDIPADLLGEPKPAIPPPTDNAAATEADAERQRQIEEQTKGMTPKAAERFKKIEARAYEAEKKARAVEAELAAERARKAAAPAQPQVDMSEIEMLRKQNQELDEIVSKAAIQEHPGFKAKYDAAIAREISTMTKLIPEEHAAEFAILASMPESKKRNERIEEITEGLQDNIQKTKIRIGLAKTDGLAAERAEQLANWKNNKVHAEAEKIRQQEREAALQQEIQKVAWIKVMQKMTSPESGLEVFRKSEGSDEWNAGVDARVESVERVLSSLHSMQPEQVAELAARSVALDDYRRMFIAQRILVQKLSSELEELKSASPNPSDNQGGGGNVPDTLSYIDAITRGTVAAGALK